MIDEQEAFEKKLAAEQAAGFKARMEDEPPIGTGPDGAVQGHFTATGVRPRFLTHLVNQGVKLPGNFFAPSQPL